MSETSQTLETPESVVTAMFHAIDVKDWSTAAELADAKSLAQLREDVLQECRHGMEPFNRTGMVESFMRTFAGMDPAPSREIADFMAAQHERVLREQHRIEHHVASVSSLAEAEALPPDIFFMRWLAAHTPEARMQRLIERFQRSLPPTLPAGLPVPHRQILGHVLETPNLAHVVYRETFPPTSPPNVTGTEPDDGHPDFHSLQIAHTRRDPNGRWRMIVSERHLFYEGAMVAIGKDAE